MEKTILSKTVISNCFIQAIIFWLFIPNSTIKFYYNRKYKVLSFYIVVRNKYKVTFCRDKSYPKYSKYLFHIKPKYSLLAS